MRATARSRWATRPAPRPTEARIDGHAAPAQRDRARSAGCNRAGTPSASVSPPGQPRPAARAWCREASPAAGRRGRAPPRKDETLLAPPGSRARETRSRSVRVAGRIGVSPLTAAPVMVGRCGGLSRGEPSPVPRAEGWKGDLLVIAAGMLYAEAGLGVFRGRKSGETRCAPPNHLGSLKPMFTAEGTPNLPARGRGAARPRRAPAGPGGHIKIAAPPTTTDHCCSQHPTATDHGNRSQPNTKPLLQGRRRHALVLL